MVVNMIVYFLLVVDSSTSVKYSLDFISEFNSTVRDLTVACG